MVGSQLDHDPEIQDVLSWKDSSDTWKLGSGGVDNELDRRFIPRSILEAKFKAPHKVEALLHALFRTSNSPLPDAEFIRKRYLRSFVILLCVSQGHMIYHFIEHKSLQDSRLPFRALPHEGVYIVKTYRTVEAKTYFNTERNAFRSLKKAGLPPPHIIGFYGSFQRGQCFNIVLEYADFGNLKEYIKKVPPPSSTEDTILFWNNFFDVSHRLLTIHEIQEGSLKEPQILLGWHHNVKPSNILVKWRSATSPYDCHFMLADLGLSHFKRHIGPKQGAKDRDAFGTVVYNAPETCRMDRALEGEGLEVKQEVDIWSMGCVYSEVTTWVGHGWNKVDEYRRRRRHEFKEKTGRDGECFHDGINKLDTVEQIHAETLLNRRVSDHVTPLVLENLVPYMMIVGGPRLTAKFIFESSKRIIREAKTKGDKRIHKVTHYRNDHATYEGGQPQMPPNLPPDHDVGTRDDSPYATERSFDSGKIDVEWKTDREHGRNHKLGNEDFLEEQRGRDHVSLSGFLQEGAETQPQQEEYSTALQLQIASSRGHYHAVQTLLNEGADINAQSGKYGSALQAASAGGYETVVRLLLREGADVNSQSGKYGNALQAASAGGYETVVRLLLGEGADVNAQNGEYGSALQAASARDHQVVIRMLIDKGAHFKSMSKYGRSGEDDDDAASSSSLTWSTRSLTSESAKSSLLFSAFSASSATSTASATSMENELPEAIFTILTSEVFFDLELEILFKELLEIRGDLLFIRIFKREVRELCSALRTEKPSNLQKGLIRILRRHSQYFAFRVCRLLNPSTAQDGQRFKELMQQIPVAAAEVEKYLQDLSHVDQPQQDAATVGSKQEMIKGKTSNSDFKNAVYDVGDHTKSQSRRNILQGGEFADDESHASDSSDDGTDRFPQSLTKDTISWLTKSKSFRSFKDHITRSIRSPLEHVQEVLHKNSSVSKMYSATLHIDWELISYTKSELEEGQNLSTVLVLSGDVVNAEASPCLEYCRRIWPVTGEFVLKALEKAIKYGSHEESTFLEIKIAYKLWAENVSIPKEKATILVDGPREYVTGITQQLAWLSTVFRLPFEKKFARSDFIIHETKDSGIFKLRLLKLRDIRPTSRACWHPIFLNGVLAYGFPIRVRDEEVGVELPFDAMTYLAGISGPVEYKGGAVLKGYSTIIFPKPALPRTTGSDQTSGQWHLIYDRKPTPISLSLLVEEKGRALLPLTDLISLAQQRTFLGCYKQVDIHLGTKDIAYGRIGFSHASHPKRKPEFSSFSFTFSLPKFGGPSAIANFTIPKRMSLTREEDCYEQILSYSSKMPLILYDESDRRAWMVPALSVILHMIHLWAFQQKKDFPALMIAELPYAKPAWDIGREAQEVIYENSSLQLYLSKGDNKPYLLKDLVHKYWSEMERIIGAENDHRSSGDHLTGWDLMELITRDPLSQAKAPATIEFKGNWNGLASDPNIVVLFCRGLGEVIVPNADTQRLCRLWKSVPTEEDYLTASVKCIQHWSQRFSEPDHCSKLGHTLFWQPSPEGRPFADCSHDERSRCQRVQELVKKCSHLQPIDDLESRGAIVFGYRHNKLQKQPR